MQEIKNPNQMNIILGIVGVVMGVLLIFVPGMLVDLGAYQFYCNYFGIAIIIFALGWIFYYARRSAQFKAFMASDQEKIQWNYDDALYRSFIGELLTIQKKSSRKRFLILWGVIIALSVALYFLLSPESRNFAFFFGGFFTLTAAIFVLVAPNAFRFRAAEKPYCSIIAVNEAYTMGRYHRWDRCRAKVKFHENGENEFHVLGLNYEGFTANGKLFREWSALFPNSEEGTLKEAREMASKINKATKVFESKPKKDILERAFDKMLGRDKPAPDKGKKK